MIRFTCLINFGNLILALSKIEETTTSHTPCYLHNKLILIKFSAISLTDVSVFDLPHLFLCVL